MVPVIHTCQIPALTPQKDQRQPHVGRTGVLLCPCVRFVLPAPFTPGTTSECHRYAVRVRVAQPLHEETAHVAIAGVFSSCGRAFNKSVI